MSGTYFPWWFTMNHEWQLLPLVVHHEPRVAVAALCPPPHQCLFTGILTVDFVLRFPPSTARTSNVDPLLRKIHFSGRAVINAAHLIVMFIQDVFNCDRKIRSVIICCLDQTRKVVLCAC